MGKLFYDSVAIVNLSDSPPPPLSHSAPSPLPLALRYTHAWAAPPHTHSSYRTQTPRFLLPSLVARGAYSFLRLFEATAAKTTATVAAKLDRLIWLYLDAGAATIPFPLPSRAAFLCALTGTLSA